MLSQKVKRRIARNKRRRIECRTKNGRDFNRLVRSVHRRTANQTVEMLLGLSARLNDVSGVNGTGKVMRISRFLQPTEDIVIGIDPGVKETSVVTIKLGKRRSEPGPYDISFNSLPVIMDEAHHFTGDLANEVAKLNAADRVAEIEALVAPKMVQHPDGKTEILGYSPESVGNPNNCDTCRWKLQPDGGHCYMFRDEPKEVCMQHTGRALLMDAKLSPIKQFFSVDPQRDPL